MGIRAHAYEDTAEYLCDLCALAKLRLGCLEAPEDETLFTQSKTLEKTLRSQSRKATRQGGAQGLEYAFSVFALTPFEQHCVRLALAAELDPGVGDTCSRLLGRDCRLPTAGLCAQTFTKDEKQRLELARQFSVRWEMLGYFFTPPPAGYLYSLLDHPLKLLPRMRAIACDPQQESGSPMASPITYWPWDTPPALITRQELPRRLLALSELGGTKWFLLWGAGGAGKRLIARHYCSWTGLVMVEADLGRLSRDPEAFEAEARDALREALLWRGAACFSHLETLTKEEDGERLARLLRLLTGGPKTVFFLSEERWRPPFSQGESLFAELEVPQPDAGERAAHWAALLAGTPGVELLPISALAAKFAFTPGQIEGALRRAVLLAREEGTDALTSTLLHRACREEVSHKLGEQAARVPVKYSWGDLILPSIAKNQLREACNQVQFSNKVYGDWGFGEKIAYGRGVSMLFCGPPGTGKTMAAQVIAGELQLELYKVDLSAVVSKYVGETEKNLSNVFAEVKKSQSILFFDEADALFGKRSEVRDANDKYANMETAYLLQKMEEYEGIIVLATNFLQNFDDAFRRRIKFIVEFPFPDENYRLRLWESVFPKEVPLEEGIDYQFLAGNFQLSGSNIKNVAVAAAFLAASREEPVTMRHILRAVSAELRKAGKTLTPEDFREYQSILEDSGENELCQARPVTSG